MQYKNEKKKTAKGYTEHFLDFDSSDNEFKRSAGNS